jgi:hypothetical protein
VEQKPFITIFPNPFSSQTTLHSDNILKNATLTVCNTYGQTIRQIKNISGQTFTFNRDNLPAGLYILRMMQDNKTLATEKILIADY